MNFFFFSYTGFFKKKKKTDGSSIPLIYMYSDTFLEYLLSARHFIKSFQNTLSFLFGNVS